jgi:ubiquinone/menaquinone biosynthesis C-methylase UbiE
MELDNAIDLIIKGVNQEGPPQAWADLGAGSGLFSRALSALLPEKSIIHAVDKNYKAGQKIESEKVSTQIVLTKKYFTAGLDIRGCDGLLMANSLHFVKDKLTFLQQIKSILKPGGRIIIVEYDTDQPNQWVPWPVSCKNLQRLLTKHRIGTLQKLAEQSSVYQTGGIYSGLIIFET